MGANFAATPQSRIAWIARPTAVGAALWQLAGSPVETIDRFSQSLKRNALEGAVVVATLPPLPRAGSGAAHRDRRPHRCDRKRPWLATGSSTAAPAPATRSHAASSTALMTPIARHRRPGVTPNLTAISQRGSAMKLTISQRVCITAWLLPGLPSLSVCWSGATSSHGKRDRLSGGEGRGIVLLVSCS